MATQRSSPWWPLAGLIAVAILTGFFFSGPWPLYGRLDVLFHGGGSLVVVFGLLFARSRITPGVRVPEWVLVVFVVGLGASVELVQQLVRIDSGWGDLVIDSFGALAGWCLWRLGKSSFDSVFARAGGEGMSEIRVIKASEDLVWQEVPRPDGDDTPPGESFEVFASDDGRFTAGFWRRPVREGEMTRPFDEISIIVDGVVEVVDPDGTVHRAERGDVLVTPRGSGGTWRCVTDVKKFWAICETDTEAPGTRALPRDAAFDWQEVPRPSEDTAPPGEEALTFRSSDGTFATGLWQRDPEEGNMELDEYHEVAYILEGEVDITEMDGTLHHVGPGDILVTPRGSSAVWRSRSPVRKFWAIYRGVGEAS